MGAFFALNRDQPAERGNEIASRVAKCFSAQGFQDCRRIENASWLVLLCQKLNCEYENLVIEDPGNFMFATGTFIYRAAIGPQALKAFFRDYRRNSIEWNLLYGHYCVGVCVETELKIFVDRAGIYKVYVDAEQRFLSSSFLAIAKSLPALHVNKQGVYEYVIQGATYGNDTILSEINLLGPERGLVASRTDKAWPPSSTLRPGFAELELGDHIERNLSALRSYFRTVASIFGEKIDCALSGGYDTRLLLALLEEQRVRPKLHVYGKSEDDDVQVAQLIASGEGLALSHVDKRTYPVVAPENYAAVLEKNFLAFDGWSSDGIFDDGADLQTRLDRCANGELMLNGGGGEVFRNFFYLPDKSFSIEQLLWSFYSRFDPRVFTGVFCQRTYLSALAQKIQGVLGHDRTLLERSDIEFLYPFFRCRFWMGKNTSVNNRFGWALTPFSDPNILKEAIRVPLRHKNHGRFEAELIRRLNPRFAAYPSVYGHDFATEPPIGRRIKNMATMFRPPIMRRYLYRVRMRLSGGSSLPYFLEESYVSKAIDRQFPYMSRFFHVQDVKDVGQYNRLCTLEYIFQRYGVSTN